MLVWTRRDTLIGGEKHWHNAKLLLFYWISTSPVTTEHQFITQSEHTEEARWLQRDVPLTSVRLFPRWNTWLRENCRAWQPTSLFFPLFPPPSIAIMGFTHHSLFSWDHSVALNMSTKLPVSPSVSLFQTNQRSWMKSCISGLNAFGVLSSLTSFSSMSFKYKRSSLLVLDG